MRRRLSHNSGLNRRARERNIQIYNGKPAMPPNMLTHHNQESGNRYNMRQWLRNEMQILPKQGSLP